MDQEYDAVILGTGLKECLLAGLLSVDGYEQSATNVRTVAFAGYGSVAANYLLGLALVPTFSGLGLYFVVAEAFWVSMLYSAYAATSVELDPSSTYTSLI